MPDASDDRAVIYRPTGQRLVRFRPPAPNSVPTERRAAQRQPSAPVPLQATPDLVAAWQASADTARAMRKYAAKPTAADAAQAIDALRETGDALIARIRQSYADAVQ